MFYICTQENQLNIIMKSEVEINKNNIKCGDVLYYSDSENCESYIVTSVEDDKLGFYCLGDNMEEKFYFFNELQIGWEISEKTKEHNRLYFRTVYI
jgi:hypothetical protein